MMSISIDSKLQKIIDRKSEFLSSDNSFNDIANDTNLFLNNQNDCLLMVTPASFKVDLLLAIANFIPENYPKYIVLPFGQNPYCDKLLTEYNSKNISIISIEKAISGNIMFNNAEVVFIDEFEQIECKSMGEQLEYLVLNIPMSVPVVIGMNERSNVESIIRWLAKIRNRKCQVIQFQYPKKIIHTFLSRNGEWLPFLDKKKLNKKVKSVLKSKSNNNFSIKTVKSIIFKLLNSRQLFPALFVMPSQDMSKTLFYNCKILESSPGKFLTIPNIIEYLEEYPRLKNYPLLFEMLQKRIAICSPGDVPWNLLIEKLFFHNAFDCVFITPNMIHRFYCSFKSIVFMEKHYHGTKEKTISLISDQVSMRLRQLNDSHQQNDYYYIVVDMPHMNPVEMKDYFISGQLALKSQFQWTIQNVLRRSTQKQQMKPDDLNKTFAMACLGTKDDVLFQDITMEMQAELPGSICEPLMARNFLITNIALINSQLTEINSQLKKTHQKELLIKRERNNFLLSCIPCNDCEHKDFCHNRGNRRFKEIAEKFQMYLQKDENKHLVLLMEHRFFQAYLLQSGLMNEQFELTTKGHLAISLGGFFNPLLVECLHNKTLPDMDIKLRAVILAGFFSEQLSFEIAHNCNSDYVLTIYEKLQPLIKKSVFQQLCIGLQPKLPDFQYSCLYNQLVSSDNKQPIYEQTGIKPSEADLLLETVDFTNAAIKKFFSSN